MLSDRLTEENSLQSAMSYLLACSGQHADVKRVFIRPQFLFPPSKTSPRLKQTQSLDDTHITSTMAGHRRRSSIRFSPSKTSLFYTSVKEEGEEKEKEKEVGGKGHSRRNSFVSSVDDSGLGLRTSTKTFSRRDSQLYKGLEDGEQKTSGELNLPKGFASAASTGNLGLSLTFLFFFFVL